MPEVGPRDVRIRVSTCGICGSDVHGFDGSSGRRIPPLIMGHEAAGTIESVGAEVASLGPGDRVTFDSMISCGTCRFCRAGPDQPLRQPAGGGRLPGGVEAARRLRRVRGRPPAHRVPTARRAELRARGHGRAGVGGGPRGEPHPDPPRRPGGGGRVRDDRAAHDPGREGRRLRDGVRRRPGPHAPRAGGAPRGRRHHRREGRRGGGGDRGHRGPGRRRGLRGGGRGRSPSPPRSSRCEKAAP